MRRPRNHPPFGTLDPRDVFRDPRLPQWDLLPFRPRRPVAVVDELQAVSAAEPLAGPLVETLRTALGGGVGQLDITSASIIADLLIERFGRDRP